MSTAHGIFSTTHNLTFMIVDQLLHVLLSFRIAHVSTEHELTTSWLICHAHTVKGVAFDYKVLF